MITDQAMDTEDDRTRRADHAEQTGQVMEVAPYGYAVDGLLRTPDVPGPAVQRADAWPAARAAVAVPGQEEIHRPSIACF